MTTDSSGSTNQPIDFEKENKYLKLTISALRNQMEKFQIKQEEKIQKTRFESTDEISQLQTTVGALRAEMEKHQISKEEEIQHAVALSNDQNKQLKGTLNSLRQ